MLINIVDAMLMIGISYQSITRAREEKRMEWFACYLEGNEPINYCYSEILLLAYTEKKSYREKQNGTEVKDLVLVR